MIAFTKKFQIFLLPLYFVVLVYLYFDPFKIIYTYSNYYDENFVPLNRDFVSTEMFLQQYESQKYNSFIFGSSRTMAYKTSDWQSFLDDSAVPFKFDAAEERIGGIYAKLKLIDSVGCKIDNALVIICKDATFFDNSTTAFHLIEKHPEISGMSNLMFQFKFLQTFLSHKFFIMFFDYSLFKTWRPYMQGFLQPNSLFTNPISNDLYVFSESEILKDSINYYRKLNYEFRPKKFSDASYQFSNLINNNHLFFLRGIKRIFDKHHTNYKIVVSPLYMQASMDSMNLKTLVKIFGEEYVFDYSNDSTIKKNKYNYWESSHYRYRVGKQIMQEIYQR